MPILSWLRVARRTLLSAGAVLAITFVLLALCEGVASIGLLAYDLASSRATPLLERRHTQYDPELGWVGIPSLYIADLYGPGKHLRTNVQGFRNSTDFTRTVSAGMIRVICSGDSFTLGMGVGDDHTWCELLRLANPNLQSVNMGQAGYGLDQAYLWYVRDGKPLDHHLHVLALITDDFRRMQQGSFFGYGKPVLVALGGRPETRNVPVPRGSFRSPWWTTTRAMFNDLRLVHVTQRVLRRFVRPPTSDAVTASSPSQRDGLTRDVVSAVFADLHAINRAKGSKLVLAYLPIETDYTGPGSDNWRRFVEEWAGHNGVAYVDLVNELRKLPPSDIPPLFISRDAPAGRHMTEAGNAWVARHLVNQVASPAALSAR